MPSILGGRRRRIREAYDALCDAISAAHGASDVAREAARTAHLDALAELWLRETGLDGAAADPAVRPLLTSSGLGHVVRSIEADRSATAAPPDIALPQLDKIVEVAAPGAAGRPPGEWLGRAGTAGADGELPELWRIGSGRLGTAAPFPVAVPFLDESHLQISSRRGHRPVATAIVETLLMRLMSHFRPGLIELHVWDVEQLTGPLPGLHPLTRTGLLTVHDPAGLPLLLEDLSDRIRRVHTRVLVDGHPSLRALAEHEQRTEPWVVAVLAGNRHELRVEDERQLQRVMRGGLACGVQLVLIDVPMTIAAAVETINLDEHGRVRTSMTGPFALVEPDPPLPSNAVTAACHFIADAHDDWRSRIGTFSDLLPPPGTWGEASSQTGLRVPGGCADGRPVQLALADASPHALVGGPSGSGKTNLLLAMIGALTARYSPDELELYLLDFKEGVSFAQFAPGRRDPSWLPHARLIGVNINTDREFGLALLQYLADEMRRRAEAAKDHEVSKIEELRDADPLGRWPRVVAVIDEFQYLFAENDAVAKAAIQLLEDVARRGRSQGIHLVLASQDVSSISAFWGRPAIFEQFVLRIALPRARRVLEERNEATLDLPRWHAVINHESGMRHGNEIVRVPNASTKGTVDSVQRAVFDQWAVGRPQPRLFDGSRSPRVEDLLALLPTGAPRALVGQSIDVAGSPATLALPVAPGRNLGVLGTGSRDAVRVLGAAGAALAAGFPAGTLDVVIAPLVGGTEEPAARLHRRFADAGHGVEIVSLAEVRKRVDELAAEVTERLAGGDHRRTVVVLYGADAADTALDRDGTEALRRLVHFGPEVGVHVLGWWRSVPRLKTLLMMGASVDDIGAWVALDVQGAELQTLLPGMLLTWSPRPGRGLFFDRAQHALPEVVIVADPDGEEATP